ncbi:Dihydrolipoamide succinyltransferase [Trifolium repens]|nr:Dihydrolipoamide succinyltransferase [Trifolium repens]
MIPLLYILQLLGQSGLKIRSGPARVSSIMEKEGKAPGNLDSSVRQVKSGQNLFPQKSNSGDNVDVVVPPLAESIEDGTLAKFLKRPGDRVNADEPIAQIETDKVPMTRLWKRVATRLNDAQNTYAMLTTFNEVDMTNLMKLRADHKDAFVEKHGVKLGLMSGFIKAAVNAIQYQPTINAVIDGDDIIYRDYIDISIAVGTPKGLVVPVIRNADTMNFADIEKQINTFAKKANAGTLSIDEMAGGTLTISNGGVYGTHCFSSAIVGMHSIMTRPMVVGGVVVPRPMMNIALTYDHRIIDGREAVFFLRRIKDCVEDPHRLLLDI